MTPAYSHSAPRIALVLAVLAAAAACSPDRTVAPPSPPSLVIGVPNHQEPGIPSEPPPPVAAPPEQCMYFDTVPLGTRWGGSVGTPKGQVVHQESGIRLSLRDYVTPPNTGYGNAVIDNVSYDVLSGHSLRLDSVGAVFDFTNTPAKRTAVSLHFVDRSPMENMSVDNPESPGYIGQILAWPDPQANRPVKVKQKTDPSSWPVRGTVTIYGAVNWVRVGGAKDGVDGGLWLDFVCYHLPQGSLVPPNPL